jgi:HPt (histidine-containing phosphotransfer) domain-containing protein
MVDRLILCSGCGAKNRIAPEKSGQPKCGGCGKPLTVPKNFKIGFELFKKPMTWLVVAGIIFGGYQLIQQGNKSTVHPASSSYAKKIHQSGKPVFNQIPVPVSSGVLQRPTNPIVAPLGIKTSKGSNYYVKLINMAGQTVRTMFVVGGNYFETKVPLGIYEMRYASGTTWYGTRHLFGPDKWIPHKYRGVASGAVKTSNAEDDLLLPQSLPGIDLEVGLKHVAGNQKLLRKLLVEFFADYKDAVPGLRSAIKNDHQSAERMANTLKGVAGSFGAANLHSAALALEVANEPPRSKLRGIKQPKPTSPWQATGN